MLATLALLLTTAIAAGPGDKFEMVAERQILEIPSGVRFNQCSALSPDGRSVATGSGGWASWSKDGKWIYYLQRADQPWITNLWRMEVATLKKEVLIKNAGGVTARSPQPSPDDKSIAFYRGEKLMLSGADGQNERVLLERDTSRFLVWSPDSSQILLSTKWTLLTVASGQARTLAPVNGNVTSIAWPSWSSGPFVCVFERRAESRPTTGKIWHLSLPSGELTEVTHGPSSYVEIFGAAASGYSLVAQRLPQQASGWNLLDSVFAMFGSKPNRFEHTVILTLKK
jgi:hypothetical protein